MFSPFSSLLFSISIFIIISTFYSSVSTSHSSSLFCVLSSSIFSFLTSFHLLLPLLSLVLLPFSYFLSSISGKSFNFFPSSSSFSSSSYFSFPLPPPPQILLLIWRIKVYQTRFCSWRQSGRQDIYSSLVKTLTQNSVVWEQQMVWNVNKCILNPETVLTYTTCKESLWRW